MIIVHQSPTKQAAVPTPGGNAMGARENAVCAKFRSEDVVYETFLSLSFGDNMEPDQCEGLPPKMFFSHNSDNV